MSATHFVNLVPRYLEAAAELRDNPEQWRVYESKGSVVVLAGPGSGKTKTLTVKLARMLAEDVRSPRGIACITYNNECVRELRRRLQQLGVSESHNLFIGTVHSFCLQNVLIPYSRLAGVEVPEPLTIASPSEQDRIFAKAVDSVGIDRPPSEVRVSIDRYRRTFLNRDVAEWRTDEEYAALIEKYEELLRSEGVLDFEDIVLISLRLIERESWVRDALRSRFPILVVDEYQDLGVPLHRMLVSLYTSGGLRLLAVGDPDQSIYGFTGARPELLRELSTLKGIKPIPLRFNYRSGNTIIRASEVVLGEARDYTSKNGYEGTVDFSECPNGLEEQARLICDSIIPEALTRRQGRTLGDVAVLYVDRYDGDIIADQVQVSGMKHTRIDRGAPYAKTPLTRWLEDCSRWCCDGWMRGVPPISELIRTWISFNATARTDTERDVLRLKLVRFLFSNRSPDMPLFEWLSSCYSNCLQEMLERELTMGDEVEEFTRLQNVCSKGKKLAHFTVANFAGQTGSSDHLNLITLYSAKGLEFDVVIIVGLEQGRLPRWDATSAEAKTDARRLFYVGLTRARHEVHLLYSGWWPTRVGRRREDGPSEFVVEVQERLEE